MIGSQIGPYRIEGPLGAGGMGEVHRAFDQRLQRRVAIKLIRREQGDEPSARQRFLREARAAASLSHPSIVQIHDILEVETGIAIVMELVNGTTLEDLVAEEPLTVDRTLQIAGEIAEGLAEAHRKGIVHRDLKCRNIMVTTTHHVKILDFGLAKRIPPRDSQDAEEDRTLEDALLGDARGDSKLTTTGQLLGTCHAMSPEQAQGFEVDHRSDLFSFGSLLYRISTGQHPFLGASMLETLSRILTWKQSAAHELNPEISTAFSALIDRLLEKDPSLRPADSEGVARELRRLAESRLGPPVSQDQESDKVELVSTLGPQAMPVPAPELGERREKQGSPAGRSGEKARPSPFGFRLLLGLGLMTLAGLGSTWMRSSLQAPAPIYVAVPRLQPPSADPPGSVELELMPPAIRVALMRGLVDLENVFPLATTQVDTVSGPPRNIAHALAADEILTASLDCSSTTCRLTLSRIRGEDGQVLWIEDFGAPTDDLKLLSTAVIQNLRAGYSEYPMRDGASELRVTSEDYAEYLELRQAFYGRHQGISLETLLQRLDKIEESSPRFLDLYLLEAKILQHQYNLSHDLDDLDRAAKAIVRARDLAPENPQPLFQLFHLYLAADAFDQAEEVIERLTTLQPGDAGLLINRALLANEQGNPERALALGHQAIVQLPSWVNLFNLATIEYKQGNLDSARRHLRQALDRSPDNYRTLSFLAEIETLAGNPQCVTLYESLVNRSPGVREVWNLGAAYLVMARFEDAAASFRRALELEPRAWKIAFSLADAEWLQGHTAKAEGLYSEVLRRTGEEEDPSGSVLLIRAQSLAALGRSREAALEVQKALKKTTDRPDFAYQAALVYAMLGEQSSCLASTERALQKGMGARWFELPWFDSMRSHPEFQALLRSSSIAD